MPYPYGQEIANVKNHEKTQTHPPKENGNEYTSFRTFFPIKQTEPPNPVKKQKINEKTGNESEYGF